jgi:hypothetical protein
MKFHVLASLAAAVLLFLLTSCATTRPIFDFQTGSGLVLGSTTTAQARTLLGKPNSEQHLKNSEGQITYLTYWYPKPVISGEIALDTLRLTFKDGSLQKYCYQNHTGKELWRGLNVDQALQPLKKGVSTRAEVVKALDLPGGKSVCRSNDSEKVNEFWYWKQILPGAIHFRNVMISFDANGIVSDIQQSEYQSSD